MRALIIADAGAAPIRRCPSCGVLERVDRHVCDPRVVEAYQRERRENGMLAPTRGGA